MSEIESDIIEAGALLGAVINSYGSPGKLISPPKGTHSSFSIQSPTPSSALMSSLYSLRGLLRSSTGEEPLMAAPSILQVLMKLLGVSSNLALGGSGTPNTAVDPSRRTAIPPMLSTPLRKLWVDCVILCHVLGEGLSGSARINTHGFVRTMIQLAGINPRTAKAAGGTRIAALQVIAGIMKDDKLARQMSNWGLDIVQLCQRALKSFGTGEPTYRIAGMETACAAAISSRKSFLATHPGVNPLFLKGALEDKVIVEMVKVLKVAVTDKYPEIRQRATTLACILAPLVIHTTIKSPKNPDAVALSPTSSLEDIMTIAFKNLDDESAMVAGGWAKVMARCICTSIEYNNMLSAEATSNRNVEGDEDMSPSKTKQGSTTPGSRSSSRKGVFAHASSCSTLPMALKLLVNIFVKIGGELTPPRSATGMFCMGGRALRNGFARALVELLRLQSSLQDSGEGKSLSPKEVITIVLSMVGGDFEAQLSTQPSPTPANNLFGTAPKISVGDAALARLAAARVLREGVSVLSSESTQISILHDLTHLCGKEQATMKGHQLQVILIEISHLLTALGEATASAAEDLTPALKSCLRHPDQGVRHEAAVACCALASVFPSVGRQLIHDSLSEIQVEHAELLAASSNKPGSDDTKQEAVLGARFARFRRTSTPTKEIKVDQSATHKQAIHGMALMVSVVMRDLPDFPGGLPIGLIDQALSVAEILVNTIFHSTISSSNPGGVCSCVKGGFAIICGSFAAGVDGVTKHVPLIFALWQKLGKEGQRGGSFLDAHELVCIEAMLESIVAFLRYCSELLLTVPDALGKISLLLEDLLPLLFPTGRLGKTQNIPAAASHLDSAKAAILEAFAWLPPGSYPMIADSVFDFSASNIQRAISNDISCSILRPLTSNEDVILDAMTFGRANGPGQVGGASDLENDLITLKANVASHSDRESVLHLLKSSSLVDSESSEFLGSQVLGTIVVEDSTEKAPTPLHEVGTWRRPVIPSCSSKIRLVDASIQSFAATFTLKSGKEQQVALQMLESFLPPTHLQSQRVAISDQSRRGKVSLSCLRSQASDLKSNVQSKLQQEDSAAATNITAVLLFCLKALPVFESTHNVPIHLGPQWMNKAKDVFRTLLRSPSQEIRRAAAEGLAFLSTIGVREDARFLQSAVLHDLDAVIQGTNDQEQGKQLSIESICAGRSAAVHALACMQRTAFRIQKERRARAAERGNIEKGNDDTEEILPLFQILIKILPSIAIRPTGGFLGVRAVGMHAIGLLFSYSQKMNHTNRSPQEMHLLKKLVELIEDNFLSALTAASTDFDHGTDEDKLSTEISFVAVLLRLMTFMTPKLSRLEGLEEGVALRFARMSSLAIECFGSHPTVRLEALAFHELLSQHQHLLPAHTGGVNFDEHAVLRCIPILMDSISPRQSILHEDDDHSNPRAGMTSRKSLRAAVKVVRFLSVSNVLVAEWSGMEIIALLFASLEESLGSQTFAGNTLHRSLSAPRHAEMLYMAPDSTARELSQVMRLLVLIERSQSTDCLPVLLRYVLLSRSILMGISSTDENLDDSQDQPVTVEQVVQASIIRANNDAYPLLEYAPSPRWQVKVLTLQIMTMALRETAQKVKEDNISLPDSPVFNPKLGSLECAKKCQAEAANNHFPDSVMSLHRNEIVTAACGMATTTIDQVELRCLQDSAVHLLCQVIDCFGNVADPEQSDTTVLNDDIPQLSSAIKNALVAANEDGGASSCRLFLSGCEALQSFMRMNVTKDKSVLKRMFRPVVPEKLSMFTSNEVLPKEGIEGPLEESQVYPDIRATLLLHIGRLWTIGSISSSENDLMELINVDKAILGAHAAALAIDGARFTLNTGLTFGGKKRTEALQRLEPSYLGSWNDIDDSVKAALVSLWPKLAAIAAQFLVDSLQTSSEYTDSAESWLLEIVPYLFAGLGDALTSLGNPDNLIVKWGNLIDAGEVADACLSGIASLSADKKAISLQGSWKPLLASTLSSISKKLFETILFRGTKGHPLRNENELIKTSCSLLLNIVNNKSLDAGLESPLMLVIFGNLSFVESGNAIDMMGRQSSMIISACLTAVAKVAIDQEFPSNLVHALINTVLKVSAIKEPPTDLRSATNLLLRQFASNAAFSAVDHSHVALKLAESKDWVGWSVIVQARDGAGAKASFSLVQEDLLACVSNSDQLLLLRSLQSIMQTASVPSDFVGRLVSYTIAEVLVVFKAYATLTIPTDLRIHRTVVCSDAMKIIFATLQQFSADMSPDEDIAELLLVMLQTFIASIRYNGLPNNPTPNPGSSDPALGRMCAQAITHIARIAATPFKSSMAHMQEHDRAVLEFAVRAEMSGYTSSLPEAAPKKKLSLKGFKK